MTFNLCTITLLKNGNQFPTCSVLSPCGPSVWMEPSTAQAELADAKERQAQADIAISAARTLLQEAEQAKQAAQSRRSDAETKVRSAHYATVDCVASAPLGKAEAAAEEHVVEDARLTQAEAALVRGRGRCRVGVGVWVGVG